MGAAAAREYGIIDQILHHRPGSVASIAKE
jgi:hypothetical protein